MSDHVGAQEEGPGAACVSVCSCFLALLKEAEMHSEIGNASAVGLGGHAAFVQACRAKLGTIFRSISSATTSVHSRTHGA